MIGFHIGIFIFYEHFNTLSSWTVNQGDLVRWRWSNYRNIVQINDVPALYQVAQWNGGITSGTKDYCVPGADFECINNPRSQGFYIWDTSNYRPGIYHFSDDVSLFYTFIN